MIEEWKNIKDYPNYQVSNLGRIRSVDRIVKSAYNSKRKMSEKILKPNIKSRYPSITLYDNDGKAENKTIHRIVATTFIPNPNNYPVVNHKDGNRLNNCVDNLEWCTQSHNVKESYRLGLERPNLTSLGKYGKLNKKAKKIKQIDRNTNKIINCFYGITEANRKTGINFRNIHLCLQNKRKSAGGYKWEYC